MKIYNSDGASNFQKLHELTFKTPRSSFSHWAMKKIEYYHENQRTKINVHLARSMRRVLAISMPVFALFDVFQFSALCCFHAVKLENKDALHGLLHCLKSLQIFLCSIAATPVALVFPVTVYRTQTMWQEVKNAQVEKSIKEKFISAGKGSPHTTPLKHLETALNSTIDEMVKNPTGVAQLKKITQGILEALPEDEEKQTVIIDQYIELFAKMMVALSCKNVPIHTADEKFTSMLQDIFKVRNPQLKIELILQLLELFKNENTLYNEIVNKNYELEKRQKLAYFVARCFSKNEVLLENLLQTTKDVYFKDQLQTTQFLGILNSIKECDVDLATREKMLADLLVCFKKDMEIAQTKKEIKQAATAPSSAKLQKAVQTKKQKLNEQLTKLEQLKSKAAALTTEDKQLNNSIKVLEKAMATTEAAIAELDQKMQSSENLAKPSAEQQALLDIDKGENGNFKAALNLLGMILSISDKKIIKDYISQIGPDKTFSLLSDKGIMASLFSEVFELEISPDTLANTIGKLRASWALILFHSRLKQVKGKNRTALLETNKGIIQSLLKGTLWQDRHDEKSNPHLAKVFGSHPGLKEKWMNPPQEKLVKDLHPAASPQYADYRVIDCVDPTDILLIGNETNTCVHLRGRLERVIGLIGFLRDGKTHTIVAKDKNDQVAAETQLQLMWDKKNKKSVLFVEQVNFLGAAEKDYSLENALYNYAKTRAEELGMDLVSGYKMKDPKGKLGTSSYNGSVVSLGSSAPLEYVNRFYANKSGPYSLGNVNIVQKAKRDK